MSNPEPVLSARSISKSFGRNEVLKSVNFDIYPGEVHALIGENGAGKSTLMKVLFGIHKQSSGSILARGGEVDFASPTDAKANGIAMIHQEPLAFQEMNVLENIFLGHVGQKGRLFIDFRSLEEQAAEILRTLGLTFSPRRKMLGISVAEQQLVEIGAALVSDANVILMDEPTASLTSDEVGNLLKIIGDLKQQGKSIVYISHRLEEIKKVSDRVTILRDGSHIGTYQTKDLSQGEMIQRMIGRGLDELITKEAVDFSLSGSPHFEVADIGIPGIFEGVSFSVRRGEILGIAGLMGSGRTEVARALFGITPIAQGEIRIDGRLKRIGSPDDAIRNGIALVPEDRQGLGLFLQKSIAFNSTFAIPRKISGLFGWVDAGKERQYSEKYVASLQTKITGIRQNVGDLSGGNQQKVSLAKWISTDPDVLILDEPTRGIDVGAKSEVYRIINNLAKEGKCVIMISSELNELRGLCDRVMVMYEGRQTELIERADLSDHRILSAAHDYVA
ncbi:MAG: sugar ABC transporter ATP-binding protein [Spirochaetota bacterium]